MTDQATFALSEDRWQAFCHAPPRELPALWKLLTEPGLFDSADAPFPDPVLIEMLQAQCKSSSK
jgi:hypothetical protein